MLRSLAGCQTIMALFRVCRARRQRPAGKQSDEFPWLQQYSSHRIKLVPPGIANDAELTTITLIKEQRPASTRINE